MTTLSTLKNQIGRKLHDLTANKYFNEIPLDEIFEIVNVNGLMVVDEAGEAWSGLLCGESGQAHFKVQGAKFFLHLSWYTMPSGRYEIVTYIS